MLHALWPLEAWRKGMVIMIGKWIPLERVLRFPEVTPEQVTAALQQCVDQVRNNLPAFEAKFPAANSEHNFTHQDLTQTGPQVSGRAKCGWLMKMRK